MAAAAQQFPPLKLLKASYGYTESKKCDALHKLQLMQKEGNGSLTIDKKQDLNMLFGDPEPGASKKLVVTYQYGEDPLTDEIPEGPRERTIKYEAEDKPTDKMFGKMVLTVHRASDLHNTETFGKMSPFFTVECGPEKFKSKTVENGHTNPTWDEQQLFNLDGSVDVLHVTIWSKHLISDTANGRCDLPLGTLCLTDQPQWVTINEVNNFNKSCGKLLVTATFKGRGGPKAKKWVPPQQQVVHQAAPAQVVVVATPVTAVTDIKQVPGHAPPAPNCKCNKAHLMMAHESGDRCAFECTGCQKTCMGISGVHYQCPTCMTYWLCSTCSAAAIANGYSPSPPLTAPNCDKNHPCTDYTGRKPVGYHNQYKCDVCGVQKDFGQTVRYWHCDPCSFDCCVPCGEKFLHKTAPTFKKVACGKGHKMLPGWNTTPAKATAQDFSCEKCHKKKRYTPQHDYYHCEQCNSSVCSDCTGATPASGAAAPASAAAKK